MITQWNMRGNMRVRRAPPLAMLALTFLLLITLTACQPTPTVQRTPTTAPAPTATAAATLTPTLGPARYTSVVFAHGFGSPDDLTIDSQGRLLFVDFGNGGVNRVEPNGQITTLVHGLPEPEGIISLPDGTLFAALQGKSGSGLDEVVRFAPGSATPTTIARWSNTTGRDGVDGIGLDPHTADLLVPDSPHGVLYRVSLDGAHITRIATGFTRPVDAIEDTAGNIYVADEWGNAVVRIAPNGARTTLAHLTYPDDLAFDTDGSLLVTSLGENNLIRLDPTTGKSLATLATNLHQPQGLAVDTSGNIYVAEQNVNVLLELKRT